MNQTFTHSWPEAVPLPSIDYVAGVRDTTLHSPGTSATVTRRSRSRRVYYPLLATWVLSTSQYDDFFLFFSSTLGNGASLFKIELKFPSNADLTEWAVRFRGGFELSMNSGLWTVAGELDLVSRVAIAEAAGVLP